VADKYKLLRAFYDLIDQCRGLPKGTTPVGGLTLEELIEIGDEMARFAMMCQWGTVAVCGAILHEHKESVNTRTLRMKMKPYSYAWGKAFRQQGTMENLLDNGFEADINTNPDVCQAVFHSGAKDSHFLSREERAALWRVAKARNWSEHFTRQTIRGINMSRKYEGGDADILQRCIAMTKLRQEVFLGQQPEDDPELAEDDLSGTGDEPTGDDTGE